MHPKNTADFIGHKTQRQFIEKAIQSGRIPHAWLFSGPKGIGKATVAYHFVRQLFEMSSIPSSTIQRQIIAGSYPNLVVIEPTIEEGQTKDISVDHLRKIHHFLQQSPTIPGWRAVIIDAADDLNRNAANAVLKILEEPPSQTVFFLISHNLGKVPATVRSRCSTVVFHPLKEEDHPDFFHATSNEHLLWAQGRPGLIPKTLMYNLLSEKITQLIQSALKGEFHHIRPFQEEVAKNNIQIEDVGTVLLKLIQLMVIHPLIPEPQLSAQLKKFIETFAPIRPVFEWLSIWQSLHRLFPLAQKTYLDKKQTIMAACLIIENPNCGDCFDAF